MGSGKATVTRCYKQRLHSAASRDLLCKKLNLFTAKVVTNALPELLSSQKPSGLDNRSLAMGPLWLDPVEPGTLGGQPAWDGAYSLFSQQ